MIQININKKYINDLFFDGLDNGKSQFVPQSDQYNAHLNKEEYEKFMNDNNLIPYKHQLKRYESGEILGSFNVE